MRSKLYIICGISLLLFFPAMLPAQDIRILEKEADLLEQSFRDEQALAKYNAILQQQPANLHALCKASELYSRLGKRRENHQEQKQYYQQAKDLASRAIKINPDDAEANIVMAMAMGRMAQIASGQDKINAVKDIRNYAIRAIQLAPENFKGYHILAKWNYEVSNLSNLEKWLVKVAYGSLPDASLQEAIRLYQKSLSLNPRFCLNYLELAKALHRKGDTDKARDLLRTLAGMPDMISDDKIVKAEGKKLLDSWSR